MLNIAVLKMDATEEEAISYQFISAHTCFIFCLAAYNICNTNARDCLVGSCVYILYMVKQCYVTNGAVAAAGLQHHL